MLERTLSYSDLGNQSQIKYIVNLLTKSKSRLEDLRVACVSAEYAFSSSFDGVISLLEWLEIIKITDIVALQKKINIDEDDIPTLILKELFKKLSSGKQLHKFINSRNLIFDDSIYVRNNLINLVYSPLRNFLINFGFLIKDDLVINQFSISKDYQQWFNSYVIPLIESSQNTSNTLKKFKSSQKRLEKLGSDAEKFVLSYERTARSGHAKFVNIKIISDFNVSAGFDIKSYLSNESILLDKFIEVKSYSGKPSFFWSRNEIEIAKIEKNNYFLYLVNRDCMNDSGYIPIMIQNPYKHVFLGDDWERESQAWKFDSLSHKN